MQTAGDPVRRRQPVTRAELTVQNEAPVAGPESARAESGIAALTALRPVLLRFAFWLSRDRSVAEDIVQEALLRAWRALPALKDAGAIRVWLLTIVRREHARLYRRKRLEIASLEPGRTMENLPIVEGPDSDTNALQHAILRLPLGYREPLVMQVLGGFSTVEIARELNLSTTAVLSRLFRARQKLRVMWESGSRSCSIQRDSGVKLTFLPYDWSLNDVPRQHGPRLRNPGPPTCHTWASRR
ncbi:MAG: sigma-70 family RNA polymerase sigma factor [Proteobacteria bacterium]|nr:sigma-70 family RNA polymerase sigma factor [Pseudomonadota bacterium]